MQCAIRLGRTIKLWEIYGPREERHAENRRKGAATLSQKAAERKELLREVARDLFRKHPGWHYKTAIHEIRNMSSTPAVTAAANEYKDLYKIIKGTKEEALAE